MYFSPGAVDGAIAFERLLDGRRLLVVVNGGETPASIALPADAGLATLSPLWGDPVTFVDGTVPGAFTAAVQIRLDMPHLL